MFCQNEFVIGKKVGTILVFIFLFCKKMKKR